jgi:glyoxylase-like metal-dependent hydrolase (beta-lactamase superfamily II)
MEIRDYEPVETGACTDLYYLDTGMYDVQGYGAVYILDAARPAIVDTGIGVRYENILDAMAQIGIDREDLAVIATTHVHLDHAGGAGFLADACPNATVHVHEVGTRHLVDPDRLVEGTKRAVGDMWEFYAEPEPVPEDRISELSDGDVIDIGDHELVAHHAPGHAPHQVVFEDPANDAVFTADAAGLYVPAWDQIEPTSPPPNFELEQVLADVEMLQALDPETLCYAHFGPVESGDRLDEYAETITEWVDDVATAREDLEDDDAVIQHFVEQTDTATIWGERKADSETAMNVRGALHYLDQQT